jgi:hypothetical protein
METPEPIDTILSACKWVEGLEDLVALQPNCLDLVSSLQEIPLSQGSILGIPVAFSDDLEGPLGDFLHAALGSALGEKIELAEPIATLKNCLVALLTMSPTPLSDGQTTVLLELASQSASFLRGERQASRFAAYRGKITALSPVEGGRVRRKVVRSLVQCLHSAQKEANGFRLGLKSTVFFKQLVASPLIFSHSADLFAGADYMSVVGAELGIEVDGQLLQDLDAALIQSIRFHLQGKNFFSERLRGRFEGGPIAVAQLKPAELDRVLFSLQKDLTVRDLRRVGVEKERAKTLLRMGSTAGLFGVYRQIHYQLRMLDVLASWISRLCPIRRTVDGYSTSHGLLSPHVGWAFRTPCFSVDAQAFTVVQVRMEALAEAATSRCKADGNHTALAAFWGRWESLVQEVESAGGLATLRGGVGVAIFETDEQATVFSNSARSCFQIPIALPLGKNGDSIRITGVSVVVDQQRGLISGAWDGEAAVFWGSMFVATAPAPKESEREGFAILTEVLEKLEPVGPLEEIDAPWPETLGGSAFQTDGEGQDFEDLGESTLDHFFMPARQVTTKQKEGLSIGLSLLDLKALLNEYSHYSNVDGDWVFGAAENGGFFDRHIYPAECSKVQAYKAFLLDKYKEGFAPRSDLFAPLPAGTQLLMMESPVLERALTEIEEGEG